MSSSVSPEYESLGHHPSAFDMEPGRRSYRGPPSIGHGALTRKKVPSGRKVVAIVAGCVAFVLVLALSIGLGGKHHRGAPSSSAASSPPASFPGGTSVVVEADVTLGGYNAASFGSGAPLSLARPARSAPTIGATAPAI